MPVTFGQLQTAARDYSPYFDPSRIPTGSAARIASDIQRDLYTKAAKRDKDLMATRATVAVTLGSAITLAAHETVFRLELVFTDASRTPERIPLIPEARKDLYEEAMEMAGFLRNGALWLVPNDTTHWSEVSSVAYYYLAALSDFSTTSTAMTLPDDAKMAVVTRMAATFALRVNGMPLDGANPKNGVIDIDVMAYTALADRAETQWLAQVTLQKMQQHTARLSGE